MVRSRTRRSRTRSKIRSRIRTISRRPKSSSFIRRHKGKLIAGLGITGAIAAAYMGGVTPSNLSVYFNKSRSFIENAIENYNVKSPGYFARIARRLRLPGFGKGILGLS